MLGNTLRRQREGRAPSLGGQSANPRFLIGNAGDELVMAINDADDSARVEFIFQEIEKTIRVEPHDDGVQGFAALENGIFDERVLTLRDRAGDNIRHLRFSGSPSLRHDIKIAAQRQGLALVEQRRHNEASRGVR